MPAVHYLNRQGVVVAHHARSQAHRDPYHFVSVLFAFLLGGIFRCCCASST
jgi:hypothetical protein